jgi:hypothetical protein
MNLWCIPNYFAGRITDALFGKADLEDVHKVPRTQAATIHYYPDTRKKEQ